MLEQAVAIGLVVILGRRRPPEASPQRRILAEHPLEQSAKVGVAYRCDQLAQVDLHLLRERTGPSIRSSS